MSPRNLQTYKDLMMDLLEDPQSAIIDDHETIRFERPHDSIIFNIRDSTCDYFIGGTRMSRIVVHRYLTLVAMKRVIQESIS